MIIAGLNRHYTQETRSQIPDLWMKFVPSLGKIPAQKGKSTYGVCYGNDAQGGFEYLAGVEVQNTADLPSGFTHLKVPAQRYAVFTHSQHISEIGKTLDAIHCKWLPNSGLEPVNAPFFERYTEEFCPDKGMGGIEIWVPVKA